MDLHFIFDALSPKLQCNRKFTLLNIFNPDFKDFITSLNEGGVKYILVGGYAVILHGSNRTTGGLDLWVERSGDNYDRLLLAFQNFGMPVFEMTKTNFLENSDMDVFSFGRTPVRIDLMVEVLGLDFESAFTESQWMDIEGIKVKVLSKETLLQAKKSSGRNKDKDDIEHLQ